MDDDLQDPPKVRHIPAAPGAQDRSDALEVVRRRDLYECVREDPGAHLREICRRCQMPLGTAVYHLDRLERVGLVVSRRDGRYRRYFVEHVFGPADKQMLCALRHPLPFRVATILLGSGSASQRELCLQLGISRSTASACVNELVLRGLVRCEPSRPEGRYRLVDPALAARIVGTYGGSLARRSAPSARSPQDAVTPLGLDAPPVALAGGA